MSTLGIAVAAIIICHGLLGSTAVAGESSPAPGRVLGLEQRALCQRQIEQVYWSRRIWPEDNRGTKPALDAVLPEAAIRERAADSVLKTEALERYWSRAVTAAQLQAEIDRMARRSKDPEMLRELHAALADDPFLVAECLARPALVDRLVRNSYAHDARFHVEARRAAEQALDSAVLDVRSMDELGGEYAETEWRLPSLESTPAEWQEQVAALAAAFGVEPRLEAIPEGKMSALREEDERFVVTAVLSREPDRLRIATVSWAKRPFTEWWAEQRRSLGSSVASDDVRAIAPPPGGYQLTSPASGCTADTWTEPFGVPIGRTGHTAVWTGSEMIVWGGDSGWFPEFLNTGGRYDPATDSWAPTSFGAGAPSARRFHTAVWTGTEMIVWGGRASSAPGSLNTGGRYDPLTDTWTATSTAAGVPAGRREHVAVWTGTEMVVWGGAGGGQTGGRYDPVANSWTATSVTNAPSGRESPTVVWTGTEMIVWGGGPTGVETNTGGRYNPSTDSWLAIPTGPASGGAPAARSRHTAVWTGTEMIVWGGWKPGVYFDDGKRYNPATNQWTPVASVQSLPWPWGAMNHTAVWSGTEMIVWGGDSESSLHENGTRRYDPATDTWTLSAAGDGAPWGRENHTAVWTGAEMIVWGGWRGEYLSNGGRYDPASDTWTWTSTGVPLHQYRHTALWTGAEMIIWGGYGSSVFWNTGGRYDTATDSWTPTSTGLGVPSGRYGHTAVWTGTEMIVWGGQAGCCSQHVGGRYSPTTDTWTATSAASGVPSKRYDHTAVWTGTEMVVWGGFDNGANLSTGGRYDPASDGWTPTSTSPAVPEARSKHSAVWTGAEMIVWGGSDGAELSSGGRYDPSTDAWTATSTAAGVPDARADHTAVWTGSEMIVWAGSGSGGAKLNSGGRYTPATDLWVATSTAAGVPSGRVEHTAAWTGTEMVVWGGSDDVGYVDSGGRYLPINDVWTSTSTAGVPLKRQEHTAVWTGDQMIVWGGSFGSGSYSNGGLYCACEGGTVGTWYPDVDGDGLGVESAAIPSCTQPADHVALGGDCDDTNPHCSIDCTDADDDGYCVPIDCDDGGPPDPLDGVALAVSHGTSPGELRFDWTGGQPLFEVFRATGPVDVDEAGNSLGTTNDRTWIDTPPAGTDQYYLVSSPCVSTCPELCDGIDNDCDGTTDNGCEP